MIMPHQPRGAMPDNPAKPPRFPYVAALLCAGCLGTAAWTWMRYSYCWAVDPVYLNQRTRDIAARRWPAQAFVRISRLSDPDVVFCDEEPLDFMFSDEYLSLFIVGPLPDDRTVNIITWGPGDIVDDAAGRSGRVIGVASVIVVPSAVDDSPEHEEVATYVDSRARRFTGASIAGLVVGAMGVFVFTVALRHWLGERRRFRERDEGA